MQKSKTGFVFGQDLGFNNATYDPSNMPQLFRFVTVDSGEWESKNLKISIVDIKGPRNPQFEEYGTFSVEIRRAEDLDVIPKLLKDLQTLTSIQLLKTILPEELVIVSLNGMITRRDTESLVIIQIFLNMFM